VLDIFQRRHLCPPKGPPHQSLIGLRHQANLRQRQILIIFLAMSTNKSTTLIFSVFVYFAADRARNRGSSATAKQKPSAASVHLLSFRVELNAKRQLVFSHCRRLFE
jgi:hypothetical protein